MSSGTTDHLTGWAEERETVRALILTSTRAIPGADLDAYSDYDVILIVDDVKPWVEDTGWLTAFGDVLIAYWDPLRVDPATGGQEVNSVINYADGLKIDFTLWSRQAFTTNTTGPEPNRELDAGYQVWVDKDGLTADLAAPTLTAYIPTRPDQATYQRLITDFLIGVPYVAKSLLRGQLLPAKWVLDFDMRFNYLLPLLEWRTECDHHWTLKTGALGKGLQAHLPPTLWADLEGTFADADPDQNWAALFAMVDLFSRTAADVANSLGYRYPADLIDQVTNHAHRMRDGVFAHGPLTSELG